MKQIVCDIESNGLYNQVTKIHCIVTKNIITNEVETYIDNIEDGIKDLQEADQIIGHNFIDYDMRVIEKLYNIKLDVNKIVDTMLLSYMLDPHRKKHFDCPPSRLVGEKRVPIGAHSLQNFGYLVGRGKIENEQWEVFTDNMLLRCKEDVEITYLTAKYLGVV